MRGAGVLVIAGVAGVAIAIAAAGGAGGTPEPPTTTTTETTTGHSGLNRIRPKIVKWRIPYPAKRKREMRRYARRHYGLRTYRLKNPKVIVQHYTATSTASVARNHFARDVPDPEFHELPATCAHFLISSRTPSLRRPWLMSSRNA